MEADREEPARRATGGEASHGAADDSQAASSPGAAPDAAGLNDKIGSEDEVFEMARERGLFSQDGGANVGGSRNVTSIISLPVMVTSTLQ